MRNSYECFSRVATWCVHSSAVGAFVASQEWAIKEKDVNSVSLNGENGLLMSFFLGGALDVPDRSATVYRRMRRPTHCCDVSCREWKLFRVLSRHPTHVSLKAKHIVSQCNAKSRQRKKVQKQEKKKKLLVIISPRQSLDMPETRAKKTTQESTKERRNRRERSERKTARLLERKKQITGVCLRICVWRFETEKTAWGWCDSDNKLDVSLAARVLHWLMPKTDFLELPLITSLRATARVTSSGSSAPPHRRTSSDIAQ